MNHTNFDVRKNVKIMIVDDEFFISRSLAFMLEKEGFECITANDGDEALNLLRQEKPSIMFLDINMPNKNGYEVCKEIKSNPKTRDVVVIMLTAKGQVEFENQSFDAGADDFLLKPYDPNQVMAMILKNLKN
jgi:two-component system alkaline phosphatase synthesis response regulator PhoP